MMNYGPCLSTENYCSYVNKKQTSKVIEYKKVPNYRDLFFINNSFKGMLNTNFLLTLRIARKLAQNCISIPINKNRTPSWGPIFIFIRENILGP